MKKLLLIPLIAVLAACSNGRPTYDTSSLNNQQVENTVKIFAGVPILLGMEGSAARLNEEWMVTAAHNMPILVATGKWDVRVHPTCDIAVYRSKGSNTVPLGTAFIGDTVTAVGYPMGMPLAVNQGTIVGNVNMSDYPECVSVATTAVIAQGMSGGGVYNDKGELIGVVHGYATSTMHWNNGASLENGGVYVHLTTVKEWLLEVTGVQL